MLQVCSGNQSRRSFRGSGSESYHCCHLVPQLYYGHSLIKGSHSLQFTFTPRKPVTQYIQGTSSARIPSYIILSSEPCIFCIVRILSLFILFKRSPLMLKAYEDGKIKIKGLKTKNKGIPNKLY